MGRETQKIMETLVLKTEWIIYCDNCGHPAHCGEKLRKDVQNTTTETVNIEVCAHCICEACNEN
jgi:hypothetical protein